MEGQGFRDRVHEFEKRNAVVLAISTDTPDDNLAFKQKYGFPFPLLCDITRKVSLQYGACAFRQAYYADRITYIIDEKGIISKVFPKVNAADHAEELLAIL